MTVPTFPALPGIVYPVKRFPIMSTIKNRSINGKVTTLQLLTYPLWNYELQYSFLRSADAFKEYQKLLAFFLTVGGAAGLFQFNDVDDMTATGQNFGVGDGVTTDFQLVRTLNLGETFTFAEPVFAPVTITSLTVAGEPVTDPPDYTVLDGGMISFAVPPADGDALVWSGTYNWLCRFDADTQEFNKFAQNLWDLGSLKFTTEIL